MNLLRSKRFIGFILLLLLIPTVFASVNFLKQRQTNQQRASSDNLSGIISGKLFIDTNENGILDPGETWNSSLNPQLSLTGQSALQAAQQTFPQSDGSYVFNNVPFSRNRYALQLSNGFIPNYMNTTYSRFTEKMFPTQDLKQADMGFAPITRSTGPADTCEMKTYTLIQGNSENSPAFMLIIKGNPSDQHPEEKAQIFTTGLGGGLGRYDLVKTPSHAIIVEAARFGMSVQLQPETQYLAQIECRLGDGPTDAKIPLNIFSTKTKYVMMTYHDSKHADFTFSDTPITPNPLQPVMGSIKGTMFIDSNYNGTFDTGEQGSDQVKNGFAPLIELYKNNIKVAQTTPAANGTYQFTNVEAGGHRYQIKANNGIDLIFQLDKANPNQVFNFPITPSTILSSDISNTCSIAAFVSPLGGLTRGTTLTALARSNPDLKGTIPYYHLSVQVISEKTGPLFYPTETTIQKIGSVTPPPQLYSISQPITASYFLSNGQNTEPDITRKGKMVCVLSDSDRKEIYKTSADFSVTQVDDNAYEWTIGTVIATSTPTSSQITPVTGTTTGNCDSSKGDINCDGKVDVLDFNIWRDTVVGQ